MNSSPPSIEQNWYQATTLMERATALQTFPSQHLLNAKGQAQAERRWHHWRSQPPFTSDPLFAEILQTYHLTDKQFLFLLGESTQSTQARFQQQPHWLPPITNALTRSYPALFSFNKTPINDVIRFLWLVEPLMSQGVQKLHQGIQQLSQTHPKRPFITQSLLTLLIEQLSEQLMSLINRTLILELNVARLQEQLTGATPATRFYSFVEQLKMPAVRQRIWHEYPVLMRQVVTTIDNWSHSNLEFLQHLSADWSAIHTQFSPKKSLGHLIQIKKSGDTHAGGRAVLVLQFTSGQRLVYKPRSLAIDVHFNNLLTWLNQHGQQPPFHTLNLLDRTTHGWSEFIQHQPCQTKAQINRFYQRQGSYLALLYALQATDFHYENLIAYGEHPILIDLETLFQPYIHDEANADFITQGHQQMDNSVLRVGLLPERIGNNEHAVDLSGLGGHAGQLTPDAIPQFNQLATDNLHITRQHIPLETAANLPSYQGQTINVLAYTQAILTGFEQTYHLLSQHRDTLLAGPIAAFANAKVRIILRATKRYAALLQESYHPDVLRNALDRDRLFNHLWLETQHQPHLTAVIPFERHDLWQGDIPIFTTQTTSRHLWSSQTDCLPNFFAESGMTLVQKRLQHLSPTDLQKQQWFIRAALATLAMGDGAQSHYDWDQLPQPSTQPDPLTLACDIADKLATLAIHNDKTAVVTWLGLTMTPNQQWQLQPIDLDLYGGLAGIALFLAHVHQQTNTLRYQQLAQQIVQTICHQIEKHPLEILTIGGFTGWGGLIYTLAELGHMWQDQTLLAQAQSLAAALPPLIAKDSLFDVMNGAAGCIGGLLTLYQHTGDQTALETAVLCGDHLIKHAQPQPTGLAWHTGEDSTPLLGFSHGVAGIATMLLRLAATTGAGRFHQTALAALAYEQSQLVTAVGNWPDLRKFDDAPTDQPQFMCAWCHGAPGIGLARLSTLPYLNNDTIQTEIDIALQTTLNQGFGSNHSLCHGDFGNLELLALAHARLNQPEIQEMHQQIASKIMASIQKHGYLCGVPLGVETPGLMMGLAGIGYGLLRLVAANTLPAILTLESTPPTSF